MSTGNAVWPECDVCGKAIRSPQEGVLSIHANSADDRRHEISRWEQANPPKGVVGLSAADLFTMPELVVWLWSHNSCAPEENDYLIYGDRIDTSAKALEWTLHLMEKPWFTATDWADVMRRFKLNHAGA